MKSITRRDFIKSTAIAIIGLPVAVNASTVTLQWNKVVEAIGYKIYWGFDSRFLDGVSGTLASGIPYGGTCVIVSGTTARIDTNPDPEIENIEIVTVTEDTVVSSPIDVLDLDMFSLVLAPGYYYFAVTAYNNYGESGYSLECPADITNPGPGDVDGMHVVYFRVPPPPNGEECTDFKLILQVKV